MKVLLISDNRFPDADAGAVRENVLASVLIKNGYEVYRVGRFSRASQIIDGVTCITVPDKGKNAKGNKINLLMFNYYVMKNVKMLHKINQFDAFMITGCKARLVRVLKKFAIKNNIRLVYNSVEYYSKEQFKHGRYARQFINNRTIANKIIDRHFRVISISSFLHELFSNRGIMSVRIPFVLNSNSVECKYSSNDRIEIAYIGRPSRGKDYLKDFIDALAQLTDDELKKIHLTVVGVNKKQLKEDFLISEETLDYIGESISAKGLLPRDEAMELLSKVDFTVLFRSNKEVYARAGFPTKVTESLMSGVPVITNLTSDLGLYIKDGESGLVIRDKGSIVECYRKAIKMSKDQLHFMKVKARETAEIGLEACNYEKELKTIFES